MNETNTSEMDNFLESFKKTAMDSLKELSDVQWDCLPQFIINLGDFFTPGISV